tara:strand:- start:181 stop:708 length:528 start_codon:yes stop_codon:yes gene_type:complete
LVKNEGNWQIFEEFPPIVYMGIDCSSKAVHAVLVDSTETILGQGKWGSSEKDFAIRSLEIARKFEQDLSKIKVRVEAAVEAAIFIQNPKSTMEIAGVVHGVRLLCDQHNIECIPVDNRHWKKYILGKGNANKQAIKVFTVDKWGDIFSEQDWCDAACIALWVKRKQLGELTDGGL